MIRAFKNTIKTYFLLINEVYVYGKRLFRYNASIRTSKDIGKMQYTLLRENHVIEKGMSMRNPRKGFGQQKVLALLQHLENYIQLYKSRDSAFLLYPLSTIEQYIQYTKNNGTDIPIIEKKFCNLLSLAEIDIYQLHTNAGIREVTKEQIIQQSQSSFEALAYSRHSIRYFSTDIPSIDVIEHALQIAQRTPSACNRQSWHTHVFFGEQAHNLLKDQGGANGFEEEIHCAILVTADMRAFLSYEPMQCYVDGGLYAMNLINAFHFLGLGTIPLSCGFYHSKLKIMAHKFDIPKNEAMICIIGIGCLLEHFNIAESSRKDICLTNRYH